MTKFHVTIFIILGLFLSACGTSQTSASTSVTPISSNELTGSYDCFAIQGSNTIQWNYDPSANRIMFVGDVTLRDATYFSEGQSLSVNEDAEDHFTCVKSE